MEAARCRIWGDLDNYICTRAAASEVVAWRNARTSSGRYWILALFAINGFLNLLWSLIFFKLRRPDYAMVEVVFLWASILALIVFFAGGPFWPAACLCHISSGSRSRRRSTMKWLF